MKGNGNNRWHLLFLDQRCFHTHRKLEKSHFLSKGSSPPEKTIRVKKENDNVILALGNLKRYGVFVQPHIYIYIYISLYAELSCDLVSLETVSRFPLMDAMAAMIWSGTMWNMWFIEHQMAQQIHAQMVAETVRFLWFSATDPEAGCLVLLHWLWNLKTILDESCAAGTSARQFNHVQPRSRCSWILSWL